jgi:hypothetical protein
MRRWGAVGVRNSEVGAHHSKLYFVMVTTALGPSMVTVLPEKRSTLDHKGRTRYLSPTPASSGPEDDTRGALFWP